MLLVLGSWAVHWVVHFGNCRAVLAMLHATAGSQERLTRGGCPQ
jgi:hypothetical protein